LQELVASNPEPRNWKGIIISVLVILSVILMVGLAVLWMTPPDPGPRDDESPHFFRVHSMIFSNFYELSVFLTTW
jgi:hypothetical protein